MRFGLEIHDLGERARAAPSSRSSRACWRAAASCAALNAGRARAVALGARRADRGRPALRRQGGSCGRSSQDDGGWRSPIAKFLSDEQIARGQRASSSAAPGDLLLIVADRRDGRADGARRAAARARRERFDLIPEGRHDAALGRRLPDVRVRTRTSSAGTRCTTRSPRPTGDLDGSRARCARAPTTSCSTASRSAAARSVSTRPEVQQRGLRAARHRRGGGAGALRLPARRAALRRAAARRHRARHRPHRGARSPAASRSAT